MTEKRMLIVDDELLKKIDENRGEMSRNEFISFLSITQLGEQSESASVSHINMSAAKNTWNLPRESKTFYAISWISF